MNISSDNTQFRYGHRIQLEIQIKI